MLNRYRFTAALILTGILSAGAGGLIGYAWNDSPHEHSHAAMHAVPRSGHWPAVRRAHLLKEPCCAACGKCDGTQQVHHVLDFGRHPELELSADNLITLCESPTRPCHRIFGHCYDFHLSNPNVRIDAKMMRERIAEAKRKAGVD